MSIFKAREWFASQVGTNGEEEFGSDCMCIANIDSNPDNLDSIIIGGYSGSLTIFGPSRDKGDDVETNASPEETVLETILEAPILKLSAGKFSSSHDRLCLAVLHPRKLSVYAVFPAEGNVAYGKQYALTLVYSHNLERSSFSFAQGPFGGVKGKDFICVLSLDGTLSVFEQETPAFSRFLPNFLVPGPFLYLESIDSFVVTSSDFGIECYKYKSIAVPTADPNPQELMSKRISPDWVYNFGESVLDVQKVEFEAKKILVILCDRSLYALEDFGVIRFVKALEYSPLALTCYSTDYEDWVMSLVASATTQTLLVYKENVLKWMCQLPFTPISIGRGNFEGLRGSIVAVSDTGRCVACYLGTDPSLFVAPTLDSRDIDYGSADEELSKLYKTIREANKQTHSITSSRKEKELFISCHLHGNIVPCQYESQLEEAVQVTAGITLKCPLPLNSVRVAIDVARPLAASREVFAIPSLRDEWTAEVEFYLCDAFLPSSLEATIVVTYSSPSSAAPRVERQNLTLPLSLVGQAATPTRDADYKITLATNKSITNLFGVFLEFEPVEGASATAFAIRYFCGPVVTVLASKTSQKYRIQSDDLPAIWLLAQALVSRLSRKDSDDFACTFSSSLPLHEVYLEIDGHFEAKNKFEVSKTTLSQRAAQFRAIQRRLLIQLRERTPVPLTNLDSVLEGTFQQLVELEREVRNQESSVYQCRSRLSCCLNLLLLLVKLTTRMEVDEYEILRSAIVPEIHAGTAQSWEATTDSALIHLLRTQLNKTSGKQDSISTLVASSSAGEFVGITSKWDAKDLPKLKKHLAAVFDKLQKGGRISSELKTKASKEMNPFMLNSVEEDVSDEENKTVSVAARLGSAKVRPNVGKKKMDEEFDLPVESNEIETPAQLFPDPQNATDGENEW